MEQIIQIKFILKTIIPGLMGALIVLSSSCRKAPETVSIENEELQASYTSAGSSFSLTLKSTGLTAVRDGILEGGGGKVMVEETLDSVFGKGWKIIRAKADIPAEIMESEGLARIRMIPKKDGQVKWTITFGNR